MVVVSTFLPPAMHVSSSHSMSLPINICNLCLLSFFLVSLGRGGMLYFYWYSVYIQILRLFMRAVCWSAHYDHKKGSWERIFSLWAKQCIAQRAWMDGKQAEKAKSRIPGTDEEFLAYVLIDCCQERLRVSVSHKYWTTNVHQVYFLFLTPSVLKDGLLSTM